LNNSALKTFARRKYLGYTVRLIQADFYPNFVGMGTKVGRGRLWLTSFNSPTPKTPCGCKNIGHICHPSWVI